MTSPVIPRLNKVLRSYGIDVYRYPNYADMYSLLAKFGLMTRTSHILEGNHPLVFWDDRIIISILAQKPNKTSGHRVFVLCDCGKQVPFGRLHQHKCKGEYQ